MNYPHRNSSLTLLSASAVRRVRRPAARALYLEALERRELRTNSAPTLSFVSEYVASGSTVTIPLVDFASSFDDNEFDPVSSLTVVSLPAHGTLSLVLNGVSSSVTAGSVIPATSFVAPGDGLVYTPNNTYTGSDVFNWTASDGTASAAASAQVLFSNSPIQIIGNGTAIANGDSAPSVTDFTDFRNIAVSGGIHAVTRTFTIMNTSQNFTVDLDDILNGFGITGANAADFTVSTGPSLSLAPRATTDITLTFDPSAAGLRTATITVPYTIQNSTDSAPDFVFNIQGTGLTTIDKVDGLQVATTQNGTGLVAAANGHLLHITYTGFLLDGTVFDATANHDSGPLTLRLDDTTNHTFYANSSQAQPAGISVIQGWNEGLQGIKQGEHRTLFIPSALAYNDGRVMIFDVVADAIDTGLPAAGINFTSDFAGNQYATGLTPGSLTPHIGNGTDFGTLGANDAYTYNFFSGKNNTQVNASGTPLKNLKYISASITGPNAKDFHLWSNGKWDSLTTFDQFAIIFKPVGVGLRKATVHIRTNDPLHPDFFFNIQGTSTGIVNDLAIAFDSSRTATNGINSTSGTSMSIPVLYGNIGNSPMASGTQMTNITVYAHNTNDTNSTDTQVGQISVNVGSLAPGIVKKAFVPITVPGTFASGTFTFIAKINVTGTPVAEWVTNNNAVTGGLNLTGKLESSTIFTRIPTNQPLKGAVKVQVSTGQIGLPSNQKVTVSIIAHNTNATSNADTVISTATYTVGSLKPGMTKSLTVPVNFTAGLPNGSYELRALLTPSPDLLETSTTDNTVSLTTSTLTLPLAIGSPLADLITSVAVQSFNASTTAGGTLITLPVVVKNAGNIPVPTTTSSSNIQVLLINTSDTTSTPAVLTTFSADVHGLGIDKAKQFNVPVTIPGDFTTNTYTLQAVVNQNNAVPESNATNNSITVSYDISPYVIKDGSNKSLPATIVADSRITTAKLPVLIYNPGGMTLPANTKVNIQVIAHSTTSPDVILNNSSQIYSVTGLANAKFKVFPVNLSFAGTALVAGTTYTIQARVIPIVSLPEANIANDLSSTTLTSDLQFTSNITVQSVAPTQNLTGTIGVSTVPTTRLAGAAITGTITVNVKNAGTIALPSNQMINIVIKAHNLADSDNTNDVVVGSTPTHLYSVKSLAPGATLVYAVPVGLLTGLPTGNYILVAELVASPVLTESVTTDNRIVNTPNNAATPLTIT